MDRVCLATRSALNADGHLLSQEEQLRIEALIIHATQSKTLEDPAAIEQATDALAKGTEHFAANRMNEGIRQALAGKTIESI